MVLAQAEERNVGADRALDALLDINVSKAIVALIHEL